MASFTSAISAAVAAISVSVSVCASVSYTGSTSHHSQPLNHKVNVDEIAHRGPYIGPMHTGSLGQARSTIFMKPNSRSATGVMALHVAESPMVLNQRIMAAKSGKPKDNVWTAPATQPAQAAPVTQQTVAATPAAVAGPAPVLKPAKPLVTSGV